MANRPRLDEILIEHGLATESQIKIALNHQKIYGGRFGSHLLHHGFLNEAGLVLALSQQFECDGIVLSNLDITEEVINSISADLAASRLIIPFEINEETNIVKIACEDPTDDDLAEELGFLFEGKVIKLFITAELSLISAVEKFYQVDISFSSAVRINGSGGMPISRAETDETLEEIELQKSYALLVTDDKQFSPYIRLLLEQDGYEVSITDSADDAIEIFHDKNFEAVFIKDSVPGDYIDLIDRLRKKAPSTRIRYYESATSLLLDDSPVESQLQLSSRNLEILTSLLSIKDQQPSNHSGRVGQYVEQLCVQMNIPVKEKATIVNAAYVHDLSRYYYPSEGQNDSRALVSSTAKMLRSVDYDPVVVQMLKSMYIDLKKKYTKRLPIEVLGGNIITIVDMFCDTISADDRLTIHKFEQIKVKIMKMVGTLFLQEVVDAFVAMIESEILRSHNAGRHCQIMVFADQPESIYPLTLRLKKENFGTITSGSISSMINLYRRSKPEIIVLQHGGSAHEIFSLVDSLNAEGVDFDNTPTFVLVSPGQINSLTPILERGIEDIIDRSTSLDLLILKVKKIRSQLQEKSEHAKTDADNYHGAKGNLADMNLIDLLQALGPGRRTMKMLIHSEKGESLEIQLDRGDISFAKLGDLTGPDAIYRALGWQKGSWTVESINREQMAPANNTLSNESILMEGCRLIDEDSRMENV